MKVRVEIKKIMGVTPSGEVKAWGSRIVEGELEVQKKTASVVRFSIGDEHFCAGAKDFPGIKAGSVFVA